MTKTEEVAGRVDVGVSAQESRYKPHGTRKWLDYDAMIGWLRKNGHASDVVRAHDIVLDMYELGCQAEEDGGEIRIPQLRQSVRDLFSFFRWHSHEDGTTSYYVRNSLDAEQYVHSVNPMASASAITLDLGDGVLTSLESEMDARYRVMAAERDLDFVFDGEETTTVVPTLMEYWETRVQKVWRGDTHFRLAEQPVNITSDPEKPCFFFFDDSTLEEGDHPYWDQWLSRMPKAARPVFRAWVYSIYDEENEGRQLVWLYDKGYSGKSSVINSISGHMGRRGVGAISHKSMTNQFSYSTVFGKRLVVYGDNKNPKLLHMESVHSLLGGDTVQVERKGKDSFTARVHAKILVASNVLPEVTLSARNEISRIIFVPLSDPPIEVMRAYCQTDAKGNILYYPDGSPKFTGGRLEKHLLYEMPAFLHTCRRDYEKHCPNRRDIPLPDSLFNLLHELCPSPEHLLHERFAEEFLEVGDDLTTTPNELHDAYVRFSKGKSRNPSSFEIAHLKEFLRSTYGIVSRKIKGKRTVCGCKIKENRGGLTL